MQRPSNNERNPYVDQLLHQIFPAAAGGTGVAGSGFNRSRQYRCEQQLRQAWRPGKCLADELGYLEVNSFYRAFRRWTGLTYSEYKLRYC